MLCAALVLAGGALPGVVDAFDLDDVAKRAQALAAEAYAKPGGDLPKELRDLDYDAYKDIRFKPERMLWHGAGLPFELSFFHQGREFDQPIRIHEVVDGAVRDIKYDPSAFNFGANKFDPSTWKGLGFAGFNVRYALNTPSYKDEVAAFLGASYFRALGRGQVYGLSARGLAVDTALPSGEEFPRFVEYWIERPAAKDRQLTFYALLDSKRVTGAYRFELRPGRDTALDVTARLYLRDGVGKLGIAPLTSMYYFGENQRADHEDFRPEVHDSDGLALHAGNGEWLWRPLVDPKLLLVTSFATTDPRGFGLQQRDRAFGNYEDLSARYDKRPGVWVEPLGAWGAGRVELVQIPTPSETNDNIVAFWVPDAAPKPGQAFDVAYRLLWQKDGEKRPPLMWVAQTRRGPGYRGKPDNNLYLLADFVGPSPAGSQAITADVTVDGNGEILEQRIEPNPGHGGLRLSLRLRRADGAKPVELRAILRQAATPVSETWSYILPPE